MDSATMAVINYLEKRADIDRVHCRDKGKCSVDTLSYWEEMNNVELPDDLKKFYLMSDGLEIRWSVITSSKSSLPIYIGKMFINSLSDLAKIGANSRHIVLEELNDFIDDETPKFNSALWKIFEMDPCDGNGRVCLVYPPTGDPQIWFLDRSLQFHKLASNFTEYYRILLLHCGLPFWQYRYTECGIPPYILHWYYTIVPSLFLPEQNEEIQISTSIPFSSEKVFQRSTNAATKNTKTNTAPQNSQNPLAARSATQNLKRPLPQNRSINRSSSVPRSMNN